MSAGGNKKWLCGLALTGVSAAVFAGVQEWTPPEPDARGVIAMSSWGSGQKSAEFAGRTRVFGLAQPGATAGEVLFAPARKKRRGGPETVRPAAVGAERAVRFAPGARLRLTAPLADPEPADYVKGALVPVGRFPGLFRAAQEKLGTLPDFARMFELSFDREGRIVRMRHYFVP